MLLKIRPVQKYDHIYASVFIGKDADHFQFSGTLVMSAPEWKGLQLLLHPPRRSLGAPGVIIEEVVTSRPDVSTEGPADA